MARLTSRAVATLLTIVACLSVGCTDGSRSGAKASSSVSDSSVGTQASLCDEAERLSKAIGEFNAAKSQDFDQAARSLSSNLVSAADATAAAAGDSEMRAVSLKLRDSVSQIVANAETVTSTNLADLQAATADYVSSSQRFEILLPTVCPTAGSG